MRGWCNMILSVGIPPPDKTLYMRFLHGVYLNYLIFRTILSSPLLRRKKTSLENTGTTSEDDIDQIHKR